MFPQLYHTHHNQQLEDLPFWLYLAAQMGDPVLELGCGTGRVLIPLVQAGHRLTGVDHDHAMLNFLQTSIGSQFNPAPMFVVADISEFHLAKQFPLIILPCNTFSTLIEEKRLNCLRCVSKHLEPSGVFAFSIPNPELVKRLPEQAEAQIEDEFINPQTGYPVQVSSSWQRTQSTFNVSWIYDQLLPDGRVDRLTVETVHQTVPVCTYLEEIKSVELKVTAIYGDYECSKYREDSLYWICLTTLRVINNPK